MRKSISALLVTAVAVVLLVNFKTRTPQLAVATPPAAAPTAGGSSGGGSAPSAGGSASGATGTATGMLVQDRYGDVQVRVTLRDGQVVSVDTVALDGDNGQSQAINAAAGPMLRSETLRARSAHIDTVSGATETSEAFIGSLQSAISMVRSV